MEKRLFLHQGQKYVLALRKNQFVFYQQPDDDPFYSWWGNQPQKPKQVKNPIRLVRQIWQVARQFIYQNKISYFEIFVSDPKRSAIYRRFLDTLSGYEAFQLGYSFAVVKMKGDI